VLKEAAVFDGILKHEYAASDEGVQVTAVVQGKETVSALDLPSTGKAITLLLNTPNGIQTLSMEIPGLVQTSLNLGILKLEEAVLKASFSIRSSITTEKEAVYEQIVSLAETLGGSVSASGVYPAWEFNKNSRLREICSETYREFYDRDVRIDVIHAGLECGLFSEKIPGLDAISFGPEMDAIHTSKERMNLPSVERCYRFLLAVLEKMKDF